MRVEHSTAATPPVSVSTEPPRPRTFSTESVLVSPFAPTFPRLSHFFTWIWSYLRPLFSFFIPKKEPEPAPSPSPEVLQALADPKQKPLPPEELPKWVIPSLLAGGAGLIYWKGSAMVDLAKKVPELVWSYAPPLIINLSSPGFVTHGQPLIEQIAQKTIGGPSWVLKSASFTLASYTALQISSYCGYPLGSMFLGFLGQYTFPTGSPGSIIASIGFGYGASKYIEPEKLFWVITAFNTARYAWQALAPAQVSPPRRIDAQKSFQT